MALGTLYPVKGTPFMGAMGAAPDLILKRPVGLMAVLPELALFFALSKPVVTSVPSPNGDIRPHESTISAIVIHDTQDSRKNVVLKLFQSRRFRKTPHYTIDKTGKIYQHLPDQAMGAHAGVSALNGKPKVNHFSIGIELINQGNGIDPFPEKQVSSLIKLTCWLSLKYGIPVSHIVGHKHIALPKGRKSDPASNFDFKKFISRVSRTLNNAN